MERYVYFENEDGTELEVYKDDVQSETDTDRLKILLSSVRELTEDISIKFKAYAELNLAAPGMATKLGCYRIAEKWIEKRLKALGEAVDGNETQKERNQASHITRLLDQNAALRERLMKYEQELA